MAWGQLRPRQFQTLATGVLAVTEAGRHALELYTQVKNAIVNLT